MKINLRTLKIILTIVLVLLGSISVFMTFSVAFDWFGIRQIEGNYVPFVLYANMACAFIYLFAAWALWKHLRSGVYALLLTTIILAVTMICFIIYVKTGGVYEQKTVKALTLRTVLTATMYMVSAYILKMKGIVNQNQ